ncbi:hypothetical protein [Bradyrhizobium sp. McL0615]|uniref:hypothetical protein n=1 Tax=Bradyrhizobium sp. McL0615 TaxID=3415673 RepID=UPI003CF83FD5
MAHSLAGDEKFREEPSGDYRFARTQIKRGNRVRSALRRVNGCLKTMIEAIADSKVRRMRRDLALRGIQFDPHANNWVVRDSGPREHAR